MKNTITCSLILVLTMLFTSLKAQQNVGFTTNNNANGFYNSLLGFGAGNGIVGTNSLRNSGNSYLGYLAGYSSAATANNENVNNVVVGSMAGYSLSTGSNNTFMGVEAGYYNKTAKFNVYVGLNAGQGDNTVYTAGGYNTGVGTFSLNEVTSGTYNTGLGVLALGGTTLTGNFNTAVGPFAGHYLSTSSDNILVGNSAGYSTSANKLTGNGNIAIGSKSGYKLGAAEYNTLLGFESGYNLSTSSNNIFIGYQSGYNQTNAIRAFNSFVGYQSGFLNTSGINNTMLGSNSGYTNTTGYSNVFVGNNAGYNIESGYKNVFLGDSARSEGRGRGSINYATAIGYNAVAIRSNTMILGDTTQNIQVGIGTASPTQKLTIKGNFSFVAYNDGMFYKNKRFLFQDEQENIALGTNHDEDFAGKGNLLIGVDSKINNSKINNSTAIGYGATVSVSNGLVLGNQDIHVGIGTSAPTARLEIASGKDGESGVVFSNLKQNSANKFLTVNQLGQVVLEKPRTQIKSIEDWSDKVFERNYQLKSLNEVEQFINANKHLPNIPSAQEMTEKGIENEKLSAKLLEKIEELTLYLIEMKKENKELKSRVLILENK